VAAETGFFYVRKVSNYKGKHDNTPKNVKKNENEKKKKAGASK